MDITMVAIIDFSMMTSTWCVLMMISCSIEQEAMNACGYDHPSQAAGSRADLSLVPDQQQSAQCNADTILKYTQVQCLEVRGKRYEKICMYVY